MPVYFKEEGGDRFYVTSLPTITYCSAILKFYRLYLIIYVISTDVVKTNYQGRKEVLYY